MSEIDREHPRGRIASGAIGKRAIALVKRHYKNDGATEVQKPEGADLAFRLPNREKVVLEVKGTRDRGIALGKLKASGKKSVALLKKSQATLIRVTDVCGRKPAFYFLEYGVHYKLKQESRWSATTVYRRMRHGHAP